MMKRKKSGLCRCLWALGNRTADYHGLPLITQISLIFFNPCNQRNPCESVVRSMKSLNHGLPLITQISLIFSIRAISGIRVNLWFGT